LIVAPLIILIVVLGVYPKPVLDRITPSVEQLVHHVDQATHTPIPAGTAAPTGYSAGGNRPVHVKPGGAP
jgi:NADH-quinone oxidoreductase subunit M